MFRNVCLAIGLLAFSLSGCSSPPPATKKTTAPPATPSATPTQPTPKADTPAPTAPKPADPGKADTKAETKTDAPKPADPAATATAKVETPADAPKFATAKDAPLGKASGAEGEDVSGKTIRGWIVDLDSSNKEKIVEALGVMEIIGKRGSMALPKIEALTRNADAEIATAARAALQAVKTKD